MRVLSTSLSVVGEPGRRHRVQQVPHTRRSCGHCRTTQRQLASASASLYLPALVNIPQADVSHSDSTVTTVSESAVTTASDSCPAAAISHELAANASTDTGTYAPAQLANGSANAAPTDDPPHDSPSSPTAFPSDTSASTTSASNLEAEGLDVTSTNPVPTYFPDDPLLPGYPTTPKKGKKAAKIAPSTRTSPALFLAYF